MKNRVNYKLGLALKEIDYNDETLFNISSTECLLGNGFLVNWNQYPTKVSAPTYSEVLDWLHDNFNILVMVDYFRATFSTNKKFRCVALNLNREAFDKDVVYAPSERFETKNQAIEDAIYHVIEYIQENIFKKEKTTSNDIKKQESLSYNGITIPALNKSKNIELIN